MEQNNAISALTLQRVSSENKTLTLPLIAVFTPHVRSKTKFCEKVYVHCGHTFNFVLAASKTLQGRLNTFSRMLSDCSMAKAPLAKALVLVSRHEME